MFKFLAGAIAVITAMTASQPALAWGFTGHKTIAAIARSYLTPAVKAKVDAILASDTDTNTKPDMLSRATWADVWRSHGHRETASWHFVDIELDHPDLGQACFGYPAPSDPASAGPAQDCVVDKVNEFASELAAPAMSPSERLLALKYLLHFVGDLHQPLHASDNHDRGGNCVQLSLGGPRTVNLHSYWDTVAVEEIDNDPERLAARLKAGISPANVSDWSKGKPSDWALEAYGVAKSTAYSFHTPAGCERDATPASLPSGYDVAAQRAIALQLERAGIRLALLLNRALDKVQIDASAPVPAPAQASSQSVSGTDRSAASLQCSAQADAKSLHGKERQSFRRRCIRAATR